MEGWIKLHRKIMDSAVFSDEKLLKVWIWCLLRANHRLTTVMLNGEEIKLRPGQFIYGTRAASEELEMARTTFRRKMRVLQGVQNVALKTARRFTIAEVVNWKDYQQRRPAEGPKNGPQMAPDKNVRKNIGSYRDTKCKHHGLENYMYSALTTEQLKECSCPRCLKALKLAG